jgi:hypothetical protein
MKIHLCLLALAPLGLAACVVEQPVPVTATAEVTREVTTTGPFSREVIVTQAPPAIRIEAQTASPGASYVWTRGYWRWSSAGYQWVPGSWISRPRPSAVWVEGHWLRRGGGWIWVAGRWQ